MKKPVLVIPLVALFLLASCVHPPEPTPTATYTLTLTLNNCNVGGEATYSKTYDEGTTIEPVIVSPNNDFVLTENSIESGYENYWKASTGGTYTLSNLVMNDNYTIVITADQYIPPVPKTAKLTLSEDSKQYGKLSYGEKEDYEVDVSDLIGQNSFTIGFAPVADYETTEFTITVSDESFTATYDVSKHEISFIGTRALEDKDAFTITVTVPAPTEYTLTLDLKNCNVSGEVTYSKTYTAGATIESVTVTPNDNYVLTENSVSSTYQQYWDISTDGSYVLSNLVMDTNHTIVITATEPTPPSTPWYLDEDYIDSLTKDDIGLKRVIPVNGINQMVRLIGVDHDTLANNAYIKAHTTWEFVNLLSDKDGYSLATAWDWEDGSESINQDYLNSNLRKALEDEGSADIAWYQKGSSTKSDVYTQSVLNMLPSDLQGVIKKVKKTVATTSYYAATTYEAKVFPLSYQEMTEPSLVAAKDEGTTYSFYKGKGDTDTNRIKRQVKWHDQAERSYTTITDGKYAESQNYAGYNSEVSNEGGRRWLRSPYVPGYDNFARSIYASGNLSGGEIYKYAYAVAPAFCLGEQKWYLNEDYIDSLDEDDIGTERTLKVNGIKQKVRLIGIDHDDLAYGATKAHTTWEFVDLLSDENGYSLATIWDWEKDDKSTNYDFPNSNFRKAFDWGGTATLSWYQKASSTKSTIYTEPVLYMFPKDLQSVIQEVKKPVATTTRYEVDTYNMKVFPLSYREMTADSSDHAKDEGSTYAFYRGKGDTDANRIKHQVKWHDGAAASYTIITDDYAALNYAGCNSEDSEEGGKYWLRSPNTDNRNGAWGIDCDGSARNNISISSTVYAIAPAFCLGKQKWYLNKNYINSLGKTDIGRTQTLKVNGVNHTVRLIGLDHDDEVNSEGEIIGKTHTTWEFANLLSDEDGYALATPWNWQHDEGSTNLDYLNSNLRKTFARGGSGEIDWYRKSQTVSELTQQSEYDYKMVSEMLPSDLLGVIKLVKKPVRTSASYEISSYNTKVFPLSYREMTAASSDYAKDEGSTYEFYKNFGDTNDNRIKHQVKWHNGATTSGVSITDRTHKADNYAGYNADTKDKYGGFYWLRSPNVKDTDFAWSVASDGSLAAETGFVSKLAYAIAPAFCI